MASVVFFRAVNVGGHQTFQPAKLAKELSQSGFVNIGAAGTFVERETQLLAAAKRPDTMETTFCSRINASTSIPTTIRVHQVLRFP